MARDYSSLTRQELEATRLLLNAELEDLEETTSFYFSHSAAHINGGEVLRDEETLNELRFDIAAIEELMRPSEA
jgi:hypothetical protein